MGVTGLWKLVQNTGRPVSLGHLADKRLAVDMSIWMNHMIKGGRDRNGNRLENIHLTSLYHRICKLLFHRVKPVFVFDGQVPLIKRQTTAKRRQLRNQAAENASSLQREKLKVNLRLLAVAEAMGKAPPSNLVKPVAAPEKDMFYLQPLQTNEAAEHNDDEDDDEGDGKVAGMLSRQQHKLEPESADFRSLPPEIQHELLLEHVEWMKQQAKAASHSAAVSSDCFSTHQIDHVVARNKIAERIGELRKVLKRGGKERQGDFDVQILKCGDDSEIVFTKQISNVNFSVLDTRGKNKRQRVKSSSPKKRETVKKEEEDIVIKTEDSTAEMRKLLFSSTVSESPSSSEQEDCGNDFDSERVTRNTLGLSTGHPGTFLNPYHHKKQKRVEEEEEDPYDVTSSDDSDLDDVTTNVPYPTNDDVTISPIVNDGSSSNVSPINGAVKPISPASAVDRSEQEEAPKSPPTNNPPPSPPTAQHNQSSSSGVARRVVEDVTEQVISPIRVEAVDPVVLSPLKKEKSKPSSPIKQDSKTPPKISTTQPSQEAQSKSPKPNSPINNTSPNLLSGMAGKRLEDLHEDLAEELDSLRKQHRQEMANTETVDRGMIADIKKLLQMFGIPYMVAPGEAEAQCATLCNLSLCDGVITDDSDIFLFGHVSVYKDVFKKDRDIMEFSSDAIQNNLGLSRDQLIDLAQIVGSDYCTGISGMGCTIGHDLLTTHGSISHFLSLSRPSKYSRFSFEGLPSTAAVEAYLNPSVDSTGEAFSWREPDVDQIVGYLGRQLGWSGEKVRTDLNPVLKELRSEQTRITQFVKVKPVPKSAVVKPKSGVPQKKKCVAKKGRGEGTRGRKGTQPPLEKRARVLSSESESD